MSGTVSFISDGLQWGGRKYVDKSPIGNGSNIFGFIRNENIIFV